MPNETSTVSGQGLNRAKKYQLILFPFNNGATNVYFILTMNYIAYYANGVLGLAIAFATTMVTVMRALDAFVDPIIGLLIDKTSGKYGKFRPFMVLGNVMMIISSLLMYFGTRLIPDNMMWLRYSSYVLIYFLFIIGYTFQTSCTRAGQTCITNDPKQRPTFTIFNTVASLIGMGSIQLVAALVGGKVGYGGTEFFNILIPMAIILSAVLTIFALIGISEKDRPEFYGIGQKPEKIQLKEFVVILKRNSAIRRLVIAGAGTKLAFSIATNTAVGCLLFGSMMGDYNGLFIPFYAIGYVFSAPFFMGGLKVSQKFGQKKTLVSFTVFALLMYVGVLFLLIMWTPGGSSVLSFRHINLYTIAFVLFYGLGYGAYYSTADMSIPMVADCSDYETYLTGKYMPGIISTIFSLVDKLISSLSTTVVGVAVIMIGLSGLPDSNTPYVDGMKGLCIVLFCVIPMLSWIVTLIAMGGYSLTGERMKEIQAVNAVRKNAVRNGIKMEEAMNKWQTIDQIPLEYRD